MNDIQTAPNAKCAFTAESLPEHPLFKGMGQRDRHILAECSMHAAFEPGATVVETGQPANCFYLIVSGRIVLETLRAERRNPFRIEDRLQSATMKRATIYKLASTLMA